MRSANTVKMVELDAARAAKLRGVKALPSSSTAVSLFDSRAASKFGMFGAMVRGIHERRLTHTPPQPGFAGMLKLFYDYLRALVRLASLRYLFAFLSELGSGPRT